MRTTIAVLLIATGFCRLQAQTVDLSRTELVDLTHPLNARTVFWPTATTRYQLDTLSYGDTEGGYFYSAFSFSTPEHGGTHLDAPIHFDRDGLPVDRVPLEQLIGSAVVLDITEQAAADPDYRLTPQDVAAFEREHGTIAAGSIVLLYTGWSSRWPDVRSYLGDDTPGDASRLHFPSFGPAAARMLVEQRRVALLGADVASIDFGASREFQVHRIAAAHQVPGLENLTNLEMLPATGAVVVALPVKLEGGSGGPVRVVALVPR